MNVAAREPGHASGGNGSLRDEKTGGEFRAFAGPNSGEARYGMNVAAGMRRTGRWAG